VKNCTVETFHCGKFPRHTFRKVSTLIQIEVPMFPLILVTIGQILKRWQQFFKTAAILKSTLPVEPPSREMNSLFGIFNKKFNFYWGILTFKGILHSEALMLFFARNRVSPDFYGSKFGGFLERRPPHSEFEGTKPLKGTCMRHDG